MFKVIKENMRCLNKSDVVNDGVYVLVDVCNYESSIFVDGYVNFSMVDGAVICEELKEEKEEEGGFYIECSMLEFLSVIIENWFEDERNICLVRIS